MASKGTPFLLRLLQHSMRKKLETTAYVAAFVMAFVLVFRLFF